jgi:hypothetical protein
MNGMGARELQARKHREEHVRLHPRRLYDFERQPHVPPLTPRSIQEVTRRSRGGAGRLFSSTTCQGRSIRRFSCDPRPRFDWSHRRIPSSARGSAPPDATGLNSFPQTGPRLPAGPTMQEHDPGSGEWACRCRRQLRVEDWTSFRLTLSQVATGSRARRAVGRGEATEPKWVRASLTSRQKCGSGGENG